MPELTWCVRSFEEWRTGDSTGPQYVAGRTEVVGQALWEVEVVGKHKG